MSWIYACRHHLGQIIAGLPWARWSISCRIGMVTFFIVKAEPAVYVLMEQVEEITAGAISGKSDGNKPLWIGDTACIGLHL